MDRSLLVRLFPHSLRRQLALALAALALLAVASSLAAIQALRSSADATRALAGVRLARMQEAQELVRNALLVERGLGELVAADTPARVHAGYAAILQQLATIDGLVDRIGSADGGAAILDLRQASQLFRNTCHVLVRLRDEELEGKAAGLPAQGDRTDTLRRFHAELRRQTLGMAAAAEAVSLELTEAFGAAVGRLAESSRASEQLVAALLAASLLLAGLGWRLIAARLLDRLQAVSVSLRQGEAGTRPPRLKVQGDDEIGDMARAVERFLEDRQRLAEANTELEAFSYSVSHDLRAPLRHVDGFVALLRARAGPSLDEPSRHYLTAIADAAARMASLVEGLLSFLRMRRAEMVVVHVDVGALVRRAVAELEPQTAGREVEWVIGDLPVIAADRDMLDLALRNVIGNAVKFTRPQGRARIEVGSLPLRSAEDVLFVRDDGVGFDMAHADKLFRVFHRLHGVEEFAGTGIGLASVRRIVERHGGRVWAEGAPGKGATFYLAFPRRP